MNETIGNRIAKYRKEKGFTQEGLAEKLGVSSQAVSKWENDISCPDIGLLPPLCKLLGITTDELLTGNSTAVRMLPERERKPLEELTFRVRINSVAGDKVRVNLPMTLLQAALELGLELPQLQNDVLGRIDLAHIVNLVQQGAAGNLVEMTGAQGDTVLVFVE